MDRNWTLELFIPAGKQSDYEKLVSFLAKQRCDFDCELETSECFKVTIYVLGQTILNVLPNG